MNHMISVLHLIDIAASEHEISKVRALLDSNPDINLTTLKLRSSDSPLYNSAMFGRLEACTFFIDIGCDVNLIKHGYSTPLAAAANSNHIDIMELLLEHGADINAYEISSISALTCAVVSGSLQAVNLLITNGADVNRLSLQQYLTPLDLAIIWSHEEIERKLREQGAVSNVQNNHDWSLEPAGGISAYINNTIGRVILIDFNKSDDGVFNRIAMVNKDKNLLLFSVGNYLHSKPMVEFHIILPRTWNPYSTLERSVFPYEVMNMLKGEVKSGRNFKDGDFISCEDEFCSHLNWPEKLAGFYLVDYQYNKENEDDELDNNSDDLIGMYTLIPVKKTKKGYTTQSLDTLKSKKWKAIEFSDVSLIWDE